MKEKLKLLLPTSCVLISEVLFYILQKVLMKFAICNVTKGTCTSHTLSQVSDNKPSEVLLGSPHLTAALLCIKAQSTFLFFFYQQPYVFTAGCK